MRKPVYQQLQQQQHFQKQQLFEQAQRQYSTEHRITSAALSSLEFTKYSSTTTQFSSIQHSQRIFDTAILSPSKAFQGGVETSQRPINNHQRNLRNVGNIQQQPQELFRRMSQKGMTTLQQQHQRGRIATNLSSQAMSSSRFTQNVAPQEMTATSARRLFPSASRSAFQERFSTESDCGQFR